MSIVPYAPTAYLSSPATLVQPSYGYASYAPSPYDMYGGYGYMPGGSQRLYYPRRSRYSRWNRAAEALLLGEEAERLRLMEAEMLGSGYGYPSSYGRYYGGYGGYSGYSPYAGYGAYY
jgi:hypothetical protein